MYVVDTNIIGWLVGGLLSLDDLPGDGDFIATHVQRDELGKTGDEQLREHLLAKFSATIDREEPTESVVAGISKAGLAKVSDVELYQSLRAALDAKNNGKPNNGQDALITEVAIKNSWVLLTGDRDLATVAEQSGCKIVYFRPRQGGCR